MLLARLETRLRAEKNTSSSAIDAMSLNRAYCYPTSTTGLAFRRYKCRQFYYRSVISNVCSYVFENRVESTKIQKLLFAILREKNEARNSRKLIMNK